MSKRDVSLFLTDMIEAIEKIERYTKGLTLEALWENALVADAVVRNLEVIGEAARHVPDELRAHFSGVDWHRVVGFPQRCDSRMLCRGLRNHLDDYHQTHART